MEDTTYHYSNVPKKPPIDGGKLRRIIIGTVIGILALVCVLTCFYTVDDKQQAVVTTFGKVTDITDPGLHFKLPLGIQRVQKVDVNVYQKIELGYVSNGNGAAVATTTSSTWISSSNTRYLTLCSICIPPTAPS